MITGEEILDEVIKIAEERPDYVYRKFGTSCLYIHEDDEGGLVPNSGCLIGRALERLGFDMHLLRGYNKGVEDVLTEYEIPCTHETLLKLYEVQNRQDSGLDWGDAIDECR